MGPSKAKDIKRESMRCSSNRRASTSLLPALLAVGGVASVFATPASALELGELQIESTLGQPLRASIAYALNPHEELYDFCVFLNRGVVSNGLPTVTKAQVSVTDNRILLNGAIPVKEPLLSMRLTVDCPYTASLARDYMLMINPPQLPEAVQKVAATPGATVAPALQPQPITASATRSSPNPRTTVARAPDESPIRIGNDYRVQVGDSLSAIASRIESRPVGLWPAVDAIFAANPDAFSDDDVNRLKAGSVLSIPQMHNGDVTINTRLAENSTNGTTGNALSDLATQDSPDVYEQFVYSDELPGTVNVSVSPESVSEPVPDEVNAAAESAGSPVDDTAVLGSGATELPDTEAVAALDSTVADAQPGDVFVGRDIPSHASVITTTTAAPVATASSSWSWLMWLGGAGFALILGLLLFGRKLRDRFSGDPARNQPQEPARRSTDGDITQSSQTISGVDFEFDDAPGDRAITLDADLGEGTGFTESSEMDVAQEFSFSPPGNNEMPIDLDIAAVSTTEFETPSTDVIPIQRIEPETILDSEIPPGEDDFEGHGEYDLSMIVDATKQALGDMEGTAKDLMAVQLSGVSEINKGNSYTLSKEVDYKVLEQDYEDELTQTQALNNEIAKAALQLAEQMDINDSPDGELDDTAEQLVSQDLEMTAELTAELPTDSAAVNEEFISDLDDTGVNEELTAEMPISTDETAEMNIESGTVDTKKLAG